MKKNDSGSKFKDATSLLSAYNSLEAEFTKKCQELSFVRKQNQRLIKEKVVDDKGVFDDKLKAYETSEHEEDWSKKVKDGEVHDMLSATIDTMIGDGTTLQNVQNQSKKNENAVNIEPKMSNCQNEYICQPAVDGATKNDLTVEKKENISEGQTCDTLENEKSQVCLQEDGSATFEKEKQVSPFASPLWREKVVAFFSENPDAKTHSREIADVLRSDRQLTSLDNALDLAYSVVKSKSNKEPASLLSDEKFVSEQILSNENIKNKIIASYFGELAGTKKDVVASPKSFPSVSVAPKRKFASFAEANDYLLKVLK